MLHIETELTKRMKRGLVGFRPELPTNMRTIRYAEEVWTPTGIVDFIRFEDYKEKDYSYCDYREYLKKTGQSSDSDCKVLGCQYPNNNCKGCIFCRHRYKIGMLVTCYECKITAADFKSKNGHNFHGNKNYYVVPISIYPKIVGLVPNNIGIIAYYPETDSYRIKKESAFQDISHELKEQLLYDALKKWVDRCRDTYFFKKLI